MNSAMGWCSLQKWVETHCKLDETGAKTMQVRAAAKRTAGKTKLVPTTAKQAGYRGKRGQLQGVTGTNASASEIAFEAGLPGEAQKAGRRSLSPERTM
jgi:hypothetical protein